MAHSAFNPNYNYLLQFQYQKSAVDILVFNFYQTTIHSFLSTLEAFFLYFSSIFLFFFLELRVVSTDNETYNVIFLSYEKKAAILLN